MLFQKISVVKKLCKNITPLKSKGAFDMHSDVDTSDTGNLVLTHFCAQLLIFLCSCSNRVP